MPSCQTHPEFPSIACRQIGSTAIILLARCRFRAIIPERLVANRSGIGFSDRCNVALTDHDRRLLERCLNRDSGAWREFVDRFASLFVQVIRHTAQARSIEITPNDVDDLCAEVFLAILSDDFAILRRFKGESALATYFAVISRPGNDHSPQGRSTGTCEIACNQSRNGPSGCE
jgi:hypothetical protein